MTTVTLSTNCYTFPTIAKKLHGTFTDTDGLKCSTAEHQLKQIY